MEFDNQDLRGDRSNAEADLGVEGVEGGPARWVITQSLHLDWSMLRQLKGTRKAQ